MLEEITPDEFMEWLAYDEIEPLRLDRENWPDNIKRAMEQQKKLMQPEEFHKSVSTRNG